MCLLYLHYDATLQVLSKIFLGGVIEGSGENEPACIFAKVGDTLVYDEDDACSGVWDVPDESFRDVECDSFLW